MLLDATVFRYMTKEEFRLLTAIEMGMRSHEYVPVPLIESIAKLSRGGTYKILSNLLKNKLVAHETKGYEGYRCTYKGYDFLALRALAARGAITGVGRRIGVGKESDVHAVQGPNGETLALKLHRLGRISFRAIKSKRDYMQHRAHGSWMYMARLAALKEFAYMKALYDEGFPVPTPIDQNRHCVIMSMIDAVPMYTLKEMAYPQTVLERMMRILIRLGRAGIVHGDFNEFNLLIGDEGKVTVIDFPQIVHISHPNAREQFDRDVHSVCEWFRKKCDLIVEKYPSFDDILREVENDDGAVLASLIHGISKEEDAALLAAHGGAQNEPVERGDEDDSDDEDEEDGDEGSESRQESTDAKEAKGFAGLVPEGGHEELGELGEEGDGPTSSPEGVPSTGASGYPNDMSKDASGEGEGSESEESDGDLSEEEQAAPGLVTVAKTKKTRKKATAKDARKNLQRQQKTAPAKANNSKVREMRNAKHQIKDFL